MRFTKQLAVCIVAVAAVAIPPAPGYAACSISGDNHTAAIEQSELSTKGVFSVIVEAGLFGGLISTNRVDAAIAACDTPPYAGYLKLHTTNRLTLIKKESDDSGGVVTHATHRNINIKNTEIYTESRTIKGRTQDGVVRTIHCNPGNCTLGSLNRFSVLAGAPMMVPAALYNFAAEHIGPGAGAHPAGIWKTIASIMWSEDFAKEDVNAASARTRHLADPTAYGRAQRALNAVLDDNRDGILNTIIVDTESDITEDVTVSEEETASEDVTVSEEETVSEDVTVSEEETASEEDTAVVVTETVVVCTSQGQTGCVDAHDL